jgi:hypothetical protein
VDRFRHISDRSFIEALRAQKARNDALIAASGDLLWSAIKSIAEADALMDSLMPGIRSRCNVAPSMTTPQTTGGRP